jgi:hypothetical protein
MEKAPDSNFHEADALQKVLDLQAKLRRTAHKPAIASQRDLSS